MIPITAPCLVDSHERSRPAPVDQSGTSDDNGSLPYPRLARLLAAGAVGEVGQELIRISQEPGADSIGPAMTLAKNVLEALDAGTLPPIGVSGQVPTIPYELERDVIVPAGLRPLLGEMAYLLLEAGRLSESAELFAALGALAPKSAAAGIGLSALHLLRRDVHSALSAASWAVSAEPSEPCGHATLAEVLLAAGRTDAARAVLMRAPPSAASTGTWLRLLRHGIEDGWLSLDSGEGGMN